MIEPGGPKTDRALPGGWIENEQAAGSREEMLQTGEALLDWAGGLNGHRGPGWWGDRAGGMAGCSPWKCQLLFTGCLAVGGAVSQHRARLSIWSEGTKRSQS